MAPEYVPVPILVADDPDELMVVVPVAEREVNAPVEAVVAPIAVPLIPVAVVVKLPDVIVRLLDPKLILDAERPDKASDPDVAVKLNAPVVCANPLDAVRVPAEVIDPVPVVANVTPEDRETALPLSEIDESPMLDPVDVNLTN